MERASVFGSSAAMLVATGLLSCAVGLILVRGAATGRELQTAAAIVGVVVVAIACADSRLLIGLFVLSFLTIADPRLRLKTAGLWIPLPALVASLLAFREAVRHWSAAGRTSLQLPLLTVLLLGAGFLASGTAMVRPSAYVAELAKWGAHIVIFLTMCVALRESRWVFGLVDGLSIVVGLLALYGLYLVLTGQSYDLDVFEGVASRNAAAFYITSVLPIVFARLLHSQGANRLSRIALLAVLLTAQVFTFTRAAWIASTCGLLFVSGRRLRGYLLIAVAALVLILAAPQAARDRFQTLFVTIDYGVGSPLSSSTVVREHLLKTGLRMVGDNWLLGVGMGNYWDNYHRYAVPGSPLVANTPHDFYVLLWAEGGILSLMSFLWLYGSRIQFAWSAQRRATGEAAATLLGLTGSLVALAVEACFSNDLNILITWTLLGTATALSRLAGGSEA